MINKNLKNYILSFTIVFYLCFIPNAFGSQFKVIINVEVHGDNFCTVEIM